MSLLRSAEEFAAFHLRLARLLPFFLFRILRVNRVLFSVRKFRSPAVTCPLRSNCKTNELHWRTLTAANMRRLGVEHNISRLDVCDIVRRQTMNFGKLQRGHVARQCALRHDIGDISCLMFRETACYESSQEWRLLKPDIGDPKRILTTPGFSGPITGTGEKTARWMQMNGANNVGTRERERETNTSATSVINGYKSRLAKRAREQSAILAYCEATFPRYTSKKRRKSPHCESLIKSESQNPHGENIIGVFFFFFI